MKGKAGHQHHVPKLYAWYHDPSSSGSLDIHVTMLLYYIYIKCQSQTAKENTFVCTSQLTDDSGIII